MIPLLLADLFELKYGKSLRKDMRNEGAVPVFGSNGQVDVHSESVVNHSTIIVGRKGSIGEVHLVKTPCWPIDTTYFVEPIGKYDFDLDWLYRLLRTLRLQELNRSAAIPGLNRDDVYRIPILLPPLDEQIRIAHLLGKVEGLIAQRKQHLQQLDDLLKSVFLEMFGDPVRNEKGWNTPTLIEVADFENGDRSSNYPSGPDLVDAGILFLSTKNIVNNRLYLGSKAFITKEKFESLSRGKATLGDVLITLRGTLGSCCIYDSDKYLQAFINAQMMIMRPKASIRSIYLHAFITSTKIAGLLQRIGNGAAVPQLTATQLKVLNIPLPPPGLQEEFAVIVQRIEGIKSIYQQSLSDLEALYGALSQQAFKGELDLSRVPMPGMKPEEDKPVTPESFHMPAEQSLVIHLPDTDNFPAALESTVARKNLIAQWLEAYRSQLGSTPFSVQHFMAAAQIRLAELHPDNDFALGANDYEHIKAWVFDALVAGTLTQAFDDAGNRIELKAEQA